MNNMRKKFLSRFAGKNGLKSLVISIVILVELVAIASVATFAWVETVSSIKIATRNAQNEEDPLVVDSFVFTEAMIGEGKGTIDLADYFKKSGDMHLSPASSADGEKMFFPKVNTAGDAYLTGAGSFRNGNSSDKNTNYLSVSFKIKADVNADFFFTEVPTFSNQGDNIRVSVTAYTEGMSKGDLYDTSGKPLYTKIYANSNSATGTQVVGSTSGSPVNTSYESFDKHKKGSGSTAKLFSVAADETKIVTINLWLQGSSIDNSLPQDISISNFGIISDLTPRHVTLIPTDRWDLSDTTEYFYAWCWDSSKSGVEDRLYKLELDENDEHYSFDYNGTYQKTLFIRCGNANLTKDYLENGHWNDNTVWNVTEDTSIPNSPVDPTFIIETINGSTQTDTSSGTSSTNKKSTGSWHDPATIKLDYVTDQNNTYGTLSATTYIGTTISTHVMEQTNSGSQKHTDTVHAWPGKTIQLKATPKANYAFVGWYDNAEGTGTAKSTSATYTTVAPATATNVTYYARFIKLITTTIYVAPRKDWGNDYYIRLYQGSGTNVIDSDNGFVKANYDSNTGYYKAIFSSTKSGTFYSILAKDTNHTDKVPSSDGYTGTLGNNYIFKHNQSDSELTDYSSQRCIWFIDGTTNHFIGNNSAKMRIDNWSNTYDMRSIGNYCYVYEYTSGTDFSNASGITFKRTDSNNNQWNYWNTTPTTGKSQYTATETGDDNGSWTN